MYLYSLMACQYNALVLLLVIELAVSMFLRLQDGN
jgi:hypothetical protein